MKYKDTFPEVCCSYYSVALTGMREGGREGGRKEKREGSVLFSLETTAGDPSSSLSEEVWHEM